MITDYRIKLDENTLKLIKNMGPSIYYFAHTYRIASIPVIYGLYTKNLTKITQRTKRR